MSKTGLKNFPDIPSQKKLDSLANYVDSKGDPLYSLVFGYQLIDGYLRGRIFSETKSHELADVRGMEQLIKNFRRHCANVANELASELMDWKEKRDFLIHHWLSESEVSEDPERLEAAVKETAESGLALFEKLKIERVPGGAVGRA